MRELGARYYPREWVEAPKLGFPTPVQWWMSGRLRPWIGSRLGGKSWSRRILGDGTIDSLSVAEDFELIWTLAGLEEFLSLAFPGRSRADIAVMEGGRIG